ncbi:hypothetical protein JOL79_06710 [Microbispora sp. RL4-1S]|uniref:Uncharacterized protein n=1 Tax=Microbispora oryzae TaxID=2806554 RepID=A0A940WIN5_9ACTN|nr:hypothetical protein [Microbispora oryzae]MBP2703488.1 hypothetical protein [Microbispora oryzae]
MTVHLFGHDLGPFELFLAACGLAALAAGLRPSKYDGTPARVWWAEQRMYRTRRRVAARALAALLGAALLLLAFTVAALAVAAVALLAACGLAGAWAWWNLQRGAAALAPREFLAERTDLDPPPAGEVPVWPPRPDVVVLPPGTVPPAAAGEGDDPDNPRPLTLEV